MVRRSRKSLHEVFEEARKTKPCILFIDELDAYGGNRQKMGAHHQRTLVNQLLVEMDGSNSFNEGVYIMGQQIHHGILIQRYGDQAVLIHLFCGTTK